MADYGLSPGEQVINGWVYNSDGQALRQVGAPLQPVPMHIGSQQFGSYTGPDQDWFDFGIKDAGTGTSLLAPRIRASDVQLKAPDYSSAYVTGDQWDPYAALQLTNGGSFQLGGDYGYWNGLQAAGNNWNVSNWSPQGFDALVKTDDKQGTQFRFDRQGDYFVPRLVGQQYWDTNGGFQEVAPALAIIAAPFAMAGAMAAMGGAGAGAGGGALAGTSGLGSTVGQGTLADLMAGGLGGAAAPGAGMTATGAAGTLGAGTYGSMLAPYAGMGLTGSGLLPTGASGTLGGSFGGLANALPYSGTTGGQLGGLAGSGGAGMGGGSVAGTPSPGNSLWDRLGSAAGALSPQQWTQLAGLLGGTLAGGLSGSGDDGAGFPTPNPVASPNLNHPAPSFQTFGPTDTERYMTQSYLPALFGGTANAAALPSFNSMVPGARAQMPMPPVRRSLLY